MEWLYFWILGISMAQPWRNDDKDGVITLILRLVGSIVVLGSLIGAILTYNHIQF